MARPLNVDKRVIAIEQMARRSRKNATKAKRWAAELTRVPRGKRAVSAAQRALRLALALDQASKAA
jgi:hypothetical protein